jgi:hypothetical protein
LTVDKRPTDYRRNEEQKTRVAMDKAGPRAPLRRLLRALGGVEMWHIDYGKTPGRGGSAIRYLVKHEAGERTFERPHEAWRHFQELTGAPDRDTRPAPAPIDAALELSRKPRPSGRRRSPTKPA